MSRSTSRLNSMIVHGGYQTPFAQNSTGLFDPLTDKWTSAPLTPDPRQHHPAVWTGTEMLTGNGDASGVSLATWWSFKPRQIFYFYKKP